MRVSNPVEMTTNNNASPKGLSEVNVLTIETDDTSEKTLFNALINGISKNRSFFGMLFPKNIFPEDVTITENGTILMPTSISFKDSLVLTDRYFFPFTSDGESIEDFVNGYVELYPSYHVLVVDHSSKMQNNSLDMNNSLNIVGVYHMNSADYTTVHIDENGHVLSTKEYADAQVNGDVVITRYIPKSFEPIPNEGITDKMKYYIF